MVLEVLTRAIRQEKEITGIKTGKEEVKLSLSADDRILHIKSGDINSVSLWALRTKRSLSPSPSPYSDPLRDSQTSECKGEWVNVNSQTQIPEVLIC